MVKRKHKRKKAVKRKAVKRSPVKRRKRSPARRKKRKVSGVKRKAVKRSAAKRKPAKRKRSTGRKLVKQVERRSVERVMAGKRRRRRSAPRRRVVMAGSPRRRSVGKGGGNKLLIGLAIGAAALWFLTKKTATTYPTNYNLPPLTSTQNYTRNTQSQDLLNYAIAGGLAVDAIIKLIDKLNTSSDQEVQNIYDVVNTTGNLEYLA